MAVPPLVVLWLSTLTCGEDRSTVSAWFSARTWSSSDWVWTWARPKNTATAMAATATTPDRHGTTGSTPACAAAARGS